MQDLFGTFAPVLLLCLAAGVTVGAWGLEKWQRRRRRRLMAKLPGELGMQFSSTDRFDLAGAVAQRLAGVGAADVDVSDVMYSACAESYRYVFTVRYTLGAMRGRRRLCRVMSLTEARTAGAEPVWGELLEVDACDGGAPQYHKAARVSGGCVPSTPAGADTAAPNDTAVNDTAVNDVKAIPTLGS